MIKINKVDSLKKERKYATYDDLKAGDAFVPPEGSALHIKTKQGHFLAGKFDHCDCMEEVLRNQRVVIVDAEINWAFKDGEEPK